MSVAPPSSTSTRLGTKSAGLPAAVSGKSRVVNGSSSATESSPGAAASAPPRPAAHRASVSRAHSAAIPLRQPALAELPGDHQRGDRQVVRVAGETRAYAARPVMSTPVRVRLASPTTARAATRCSTAAATRRAEPEEEAVLAAPRAAAQRRGRRHPVGPQDREQPEPEQQHRHAAEQPGGVVEVLGPADQGADEPVQRVVHAVLRVGDEVAAGALLRRQQRRAAADEVAAHPAEHRQVLRLLVVDVEEPRRQQPQDGRNAPCSRT